MAAQDAPPRRRDPHRAVRILDAAADLIARHGYHTVGMADIGAAAGIVGSGIYRHFDSKSAVLVALFDRVLDPLTEDAAHIVQTHPPAEALVRLIDSHVAFAVDQRRLLQVYHQELRHVGEADGSRLRRRQRLYLEEWVHVVAALRTDLTDAETRVVVRAAIGAIQSVLFHRSGLERGPLSALLRGVAWSCLVDSRVADPD
jgi:AcrR family transcriptional regulator